MIALDELTRLLVKAGELGVLRDMETPPEIQAERLHQDLLEGEIRSTLMTTRLHALIAVARQGLPQ